MSYIIYPKFLICSGKFNSIFIELQDGLGYNLTESVLFILYLNAN